MFIDTEYDSWNMDSLALEKAFESYPDVKLVFVTHLYGTPGKIDEIRSVVDRHGALIVEDAAESFGATYKGKQAGILGDYGSISFNGNKIVIGSRGGMFCIVQSMAKVVQQKFWKQLVLSTLRDDQS